jgi:hypothetical protein
MDWNVKSKSNLVLKSEPFINNNYYYYIVYIYSLFHWQGQSQGVIKILFIIILIIIKQGFVLVWRGEGTLTPCSHYMRPSTDDRGRISRIGD